MSNSDAAALGNDGPERQAVIAFIFAILSWVLLPVVGAVIGLFLGLGVRRISRNGTELSGKARRLATASIVIGSVYLVALAGVIIFRLAWVFVFFPAPTL